MLTYIAKERKNLQNYCQENVNATQQLNELKEDVSFTHIFSKSGSLTRIPSYKSRLNGSRSNLMQKRNDMWKIGSILQRREIILCEL